MSVPRHTVFDFNPRSNPVSKLNIARLRGTITYKVSDVSGPSYVSWYIGGTERQVGSITTEYNSQNGCLTITGGYGFTPRPEVKQITAQGVDVNSEEGFRIHLTIGSSVQLIGA